MENVRSFDSLAELKNLRDSSTTSIVLERRLPDYLRNLDAANGFDREA